jgi:hypothetical protein
VVRSSILLACLLCGCGFRAFEGSDGGGGPPPGSDGGGGPPPGSDGGGMIPNPGGNGPGPLGALPPGYCCSDDKQCSHRRCTRFGTGPSICSGFCQVDEECTGFNSQMRCDPNTAQCSPMSTPYSCLDPQTYQYGTLATGACCSRGTATSGQECKGGLCISTGNQANPYYCSQGCTNGETCPPGYSCFSAANGYASDIRDCWVTQSIADDTYTYSCQ